jgi:hypothetical protein
MAKSKSFPWFHANEHHTNPPVEAQSWLHASQAKNKIYSVFGILHALRGRLKYGFLFFRPAQAPTSRRRFLPGMQM